MFSKDDVQRYSFYILFLVYPRTSQVILSMFRCYETADGTSYLQVDFTVECNDTYSATIIPLAILFTLVYPIGVPVLIMYNLIKMKDHLFDPETGLATGVAEKKLGAMYVMLEREAREFQSYHFVLVNKRVFTTQFMSS